MALPRQQEESGWGQLVVLQQNEFLIVTLYCDYLENLGEWYMGFFKISILEVLINVKLLGFVVIVSSFSRRLKASLEILFNLLQLWTY